MNHIVISGRLAKDPEVRYTQTGKVVTQIVVAVDKFSGGEKSAIFVNCVFWERQAEFVGNYFVKGQQIIVEGSLNIRSYDANDGSKRYITEIEGRRAEFCGTRGNSTNPEEKAQQTPNAPQSAPQPSGFEYMGEEIPF